MGRLDKLFNKGISTDGILTDDEKELRDYENNVYTSESGVTDSTYAEFVIDDAIYISKKGLVTVGTVTGGVFKVGDSIQICRGETVIADTAIIGIEQYKTVCNKVAEGAEAGLLLAIDDVNMRKLIKRNDIIKKV